MTEVSPPEGAPGPSLLGTGDGSKANFLLEPAEPLSP